MKRIVVLLRPVLFAVAVSSIAIRCFATDAIRVAVVCKPASLQDEITVKLSSENGVEVLDRDRIDLLLSEGSLGAFSQDPGAATHLGHLLALDYFLNLRASPGNGGRCVIDAVNAQTGGMVATETVPALNESALADAAVQFVRGQLAGKAVRKPDAAGSVRVAVLDFMADAPADIEDMAAGPSLSADLRLMLGKQAGLEVLDRALSQQVAMEHHYMDAGLVNPSGARLPMLGADLVVTGRLRHPAGGATELALTIVDTREGRTGGAQTFPLPAGSAALPAAAEDWVREAMHLDGAGELRTYEPSVEVEALQPFYAGIANFQAGRYLQATDDFQRAYTLNGKFQDAMLWEARCYDQLGLPQLGNAERLFATTRLVGHSLARVGESRPEDAVTFLGVTGSASPMEQTADKKIEMLAIDVLASFHGSPSLELASHLGVFRDEYDALSGTRDTAGTRWGDAPRFFSNSSLYGEAEPADAAGRRHVIWRLVGTADGRVLAEASSEIEGKSSQWTDALRPALAELWQRARQAASPSPAPVAPVLLAAGDIASLPDVPVLEQEIRSHTGAAANQAILGLLLRDPGNPLLPGHPLSKGGAGNYTVGGYLNFAIRDYSISKLPADNPIREWLELARIDSFLPRDGDGRFLSNDFHFAPHAALEKFAAAHRDDVPGCLATYQFIYDQLGTTAPSLILQELQDLRQRLDKHSEAECFDYHLLSGATDWLATVTRISTGRSPLPAPPLGQDYGRNLYVRFTDGGSPGIGVSWCWCITDWRQSPESIRDPVQEARASLAILGRGDNKALVRPEWLVNTPSSGVLTTFAVDAIREGLHDRGRPMLFEFDASKAKQHFRNIVDYVYRNLCEQLDNATTTSAIHYWDRWVYEFMRNLCDWGYIDTVTDAEYYQMRTKLAEREQAACDRFGVSPDAIRYHQEWDLLDWRKFIRRPQTPADQMCGLWCSRQFFDSAAVLARLGEIGRRCWSGANPADDPQWSDMVHSDRVRCSLNAVGIAKVFQRYEDLIPEKFPGPDLTPREMAFLHDFGSTLLEGGLYPDAEAVFKRVLDVPESDLNRYGEGREVRASAALAMCFLCRAQGRKAEALEYAQRSLDICGGDGSFRLLRRFDPLRDKGGSEEDYDVGNGREIAVRLLTELRGDTDALPPRVKFTVVRTPNIDNAETTFYYRVPAHYDSKSNKRCPILVIVPSANSDALEYCMDTSAWARFADEHGIFLVAPKFLYILSWDTGPPTVAGMHMAQVWSGKALLQAVENIRGAGYNVTTERLLLHGYGGGAQFVDHFGRWAPERCAALSLHSTDSWAWFDSIPGLKPFSAMRDVPCLVTTGQLDTITPRGCAAQWVTMARGAGVPVTWKEIPNDGHWPTPEMEEMCRQFLLAHAPGDSAPAETAANP